MINKIIKFSAEGCNPCKLMDKNLDEFSAKTGIEIERVDIEEDTERTTEFKIRSVPTMLFMMGDVVLGKKIGVMSVQQLEEYIGELKNGEI